MGAVGALGMAQDGTPAIGEAAALVRAGAGRSPAAAGSAPRWLTELKASAEGMRKGRERPSGRPFGRWLGDFLDQDTQSGLLPAEEKLLFAAASGEPCVLAPRSARLWAAFEEWRKTAALHPAEEMGFVAQMVRFTASAPEPVQEIIIDATRHAVAELELPQYWEPRNAGEVERFATAQRAYLARLEGEADPAKTIERAKKDPSFFELAVEIVVEALSPKPYAPLKLNDHTLNPLLRRDPLCLSIETRAKVDAQPRVLREFFDELMSEAKRAAAKDDKFLAKLKANVKTLRPVFDAAFARYEREGWRWVNPDDPDLRVRAVFLRFLALGGDDTAPVHESRLELHGAYIGEDLNLSGCTIPQPLIFSRSLFAGRVFFKGAMTKALDFSASRARFVDGENAHVQGGVFLRDTFRANGVSFPNATVNGRFSGENGVFLSGGAFAIDCSGAQITGDVLLSERFFGEGGVFFKGAKLAGGLNCAAGVFLNRSEDGKACALSCDNASIAGDVSLKDGFHSEGSISFFGAHIGGVLNCMHGMFANKTGDGAGRALDVTNSEIKGGAYLSDGFSAFGQVRLYGAKLYGTCAFTGGLFDNAVAATPDDGAKKTRVAAAALHLQAAKIDGALWLGPTAQEGRQRADIRGSLRLDGCHANDIVDHPSSWPRKRVLGPDGKKLSAFLYLDGFTYNRMMGRGDYRTGVRKRWLERQPPDHLGVNYRPQPFQQLIKTYREMGNDGRVRDIAKFKGRTRYRSFFARLWHGWRDRPKFSKRFGGGARYASPLDFIIWPITLSWRFVTRAAASVPLALAWAFVGFGTAYWYGWGRILAFLLVMWGAGVAFYDDVASQGGFAPSNPAIYLNEKLQAKCGRNWTECTGGPAELPAFNPFLYSLDIMLPVLDLGQKRDWQPIDRADRPVQFDLPEFSWLSNNDIRHSEIPDFAIKRQPIGEGSVDAVVRAQMLLSWGALGLLIAMLSGLIKKD
jgi:hypothetical protein